MVANQKFQSIRGTNDLLPEETVIWREIESKIHSTMSLWGYGEIRTPTFEQKELFLRSAGQETDVTKQMYTFTDESKTELALKPELTAPVIRAFIEHNLEKRGGVTRLYYIDSLFRQERPQSGRFRQFHQFGAEAIGSSLPEQDVELISLIYFFLLDLGINDLTLHVNSIGSSNVRKIYQEKLVTYLQQHESSLSKVSKERLMKNPLRFLDTKLEEERALLVDAPKIKDFLEPPDADHYEKVKEFLTKLNIPFVHNDFLVRGLDYYTQVTFEITCSHLGAQNAICGGGRYDSLVKDLGGSEIPAVGFASGLERILLAMGGNTLQPKKFERTIYVVSATSSAQSVTILLANNIRKKGIPVYTDTLRRSLKAQMREADRLRVSHTIIIGDDELQKGTAQLKHLSTGKQEEISLEKIIEALERD